MRKTLLFIVTLVTLMVISSTAWGATLITLGTQGRTNGPTEMGPTNYFHKSRRIQWVYTATEITAAGGSAGEIISIAFDLCDDFATGDLLNYKVKMAQTTATNAATHNTATLTTVKNAHTFPPGNVEGWRTIPFDQGFSWDGESNILVDISFGLNTGSMNNGRVWLYNENTPFEMRGVSSDYESQENKVTNMTTTGKPRAQLVIITEYVPVELSSFTATLTGGNQAILNWSTASETDMIGFHVLQSDTENLSDAINLTPVVIPAENCSCGAQYSFTASEFDHPGTWWFWLESIDMNGSNKFFGPVSINITETQTPSLPVRNNLGFAHPNPFVSGVQTSIPIEIKAGDSGRLEIYNLSGQRVASFPLSQGTHTISWNGMDSQGQSCASGIYFYRLNAGGQSQTRKLVILK